jgi:hypothetical protein
MDRARRHLSELSSKELGQRAVDYRRMALAAHGEATIKSLNILAVRYAILAGKREVEESYGDRAASHHCESELGRLAQLAKQAATTEPDPIRGLGDAIRCVAASEADPYLVMGVLIEGAVHTLRKRIPPERHITTAAALLKLAADRLNDVRLLSRQVT